MALNVLVEWPEEEGETYIELAKHEKISNPVRPGEFIYGPEHILFTRHRDGGVEIRIQ